MITTCWYTVPLFLLEVTSDLPPEMEESMKGKESTVNMLTMYCNLFMKIYVAGCDRLVDVTPGLG